MPSEPRHRGSPIDVIEAAYDLECDDRAWLSQVAAAIAPLLEGGHGVWASYFDVAIPAARWLDDVVLLGARRTEIRAAQQIAAAERIVENMHIVVEPLQSGLEAAQAAHMTAAATARYRAFLDKVKARDYIAFRTVETSGKGVSIAAAQRTAWSPDRRTRGLWARVAAHIAAARRLRAALTTLPDRAADAVLTPTGLVHHAEGNAIHARHALREAVLAQERARSSLRRRDPETATACWRTLVNGEWSLVERFEHDGRRYLVAHANPPESLGLRALTSRESTTVELAALGKSNKLIAYELGLADSTVSSHLHAAMRKLGISSRSELILLANHLRSSAKPR